jgi:hypothetical protein
MDRLKTILLIIMMPSILLARDLPKDNPNVVGKAIVKQFNLDNYFKNITKEYIPENVRKHLGIVIGTYETSSKGYLELKWEF